MYCEAITPEQRGQKTTEQLNQNEPFLFQADYLKHFVTVKERPKSFQCYTKSNMYFNSLNYYFSHITGKQERTMEEVKEREQ